jgi:ACS family tartrate transporter-like MFS transporter
MPLLLATYFVSITDRANLGIAAIQMNQDLGFDPTFYGWSAGIFFASYAAFEIPSNLCQSAWRLTPNRLPTVTPVLDC